MSISQQKPSEKLNVIDRNTFDQIQQQEKNSHAGTHRIRNSKYKKTHAKSGTTCDLMQFLKRPPVKRTASERRRHKLQCRIRNVPLRKLKKRGKTREGGKKKKRSRLKKSILRYRQEKLRVQAMQAQQLQEAAEQLQALTITPEAEMPLPQPLPPTVGAAALESPPKKIHSNRFRDYCDNCTTSRLGELTEQLLRQLDGFQRRAYANNELKARAHRRFVVGFREMQNYLRINKVKLVIIAPDCEQCAGEAGIDQTIADIKRQCQNESIPYVFSLRRRQLAYTLYKKVPISCVAILDYDGARELYTDLIAALQEARQAYIALMQDQLQMTTNLSTTTISVNPISTTALSTMQIDGNEV